MGYLEFSQRWNFRIFERFLQGYHEPKHGLGIIGHEHMANYHFLPQDMPNLGFDLKLPGGGVKSFSARSYRALARAITQDKDAMMIAVGIIPGALRYACMKLQDDIELVMKAVERDPYSIEYASNRLKRNKKVVLAAVGREGFVLTYVLPGFEDDKEVMMAAVKENGYMLRHASKRLRDDVELVRLAVESQPDAIRYASDRIQKDPSLLEESKDDRNVVSLEAQIACANGLRMDGAREVLGERNLGERNLGER